MTIAAKQLASFKMIQYDVDTGSLTSTDLGIIASRYYLNSASIEIFNDLFQSRLTEADALGVVSRSHEFKQVTVRDNEIEELEAIAERVPCQIKVKWELFHNCWC